MMFVVQDLKFQPDARAFALVQRRVHEVLLAAVRPDGNLKVDPEFKIREARGRDDVSAHPFSIDSRRRHAPNSIPNLPSPGWECVAGHATPPAGGFPVP